MTKILFQLSLIISLLFFAGSSAASEVLEYLQLQKKIRIYVDAAPGFGHQSAGLSVMQRLRELGFQGEFQVIYNEVIQNKIGKIYPAFPNGLSNQISYQSLAEYKKSSLNSTVPQIDLAVSGADDGFGSEFSKITHANTYLRLQPLGWGTSMIYKDTAQTLPALQNLPLANSQSLEKSDLVRIIDQDPNLGPAKKDSLLKLASLSSQHFTFPVYGVGVQTFAAQRMYFYAKAAKSAAQKINSQKAVIAPVISPFNSQEMDSLLKIFGKLPGFEATAAAEKKHQSQMHLLSPEDFSALPKLIPGHIYFVFVGSVPQNIFNFLYEQASFPVWVAGKNAMSFSLSRGKAYLNTVDDYHLPGFDGLPLDDQKIIKKAQLAFSTGYLEFSNQSQINNLSRFIQESVTVGSPIQNFYSQLGATMSTNDKVLEGLRHIVGTPSIYMCQGVFL